MTSRPHPEQTDRREAMTAMAVGGAGIAAAVTMLIGDAAAQEKNAVTHPAGSQHELKTLEEQLRERGGTWHEFVKKDSLRLGLYRLAAGAEDGQKPHAEDEVYYVIRGRGKFRMGDKVSDVRVGTVLFVPAKLPHRFEDIEEELLLLVVFSSAPPHRDRDDDR
jgi:mannose-6-phosphate isomerase-like protein (cupin superfamily)